MSINHLKIFYFLIPNLIIQLQIHLTTTFDLSDVKKKKTSGKISWLSNNFEDMPLIAAVTILTKIQADVRNAEADVINFLNKILMPLI